MKTHVAKVATKRRTLRRERTIAIITGLRAGDPSKLAPQPCMLANVAYELGRADRRTFLAEAAALIRTKQIVGRLFSFHKQDLIDGKFIRFEKVPRSKWRAEQEGHAAAAAVRAETTAVNAETVPA